MQDRAEHFPIRSIQTVPGNKPGELIFRIIRSDGATDDALRRHPPAEPTTYSTKEVSDDFVIIPRDASGDILGQLELEGGLDSVAKSVKAEAAAKAAASIFFP